jgi:hypothetical protein
MKKGYVVGLVVLFALLTVNAFSADFTYVGADKCKMCHKSEKVGQQFPLWESRKHSKSFVLLSSDKAKEVAGEAGVTGDPSECADCLKCHAPLHEKAPDIKAEGVTCEVCHGAGSDYKKMTVMKDHAESVKMGMTDYKSPDDIKKLCLTCHENAHGKTFDFAASWEKVKHPVPEK